MRNIATICLLFCTFIFGVFVGYNAKVCPQPSGVNASFKTDTICDTLICNVPGVVKETYIRVDTVKLVSIDSIYVSDSVLVEVPISQKEYVDSSYQAWISGYHPQLDSIKIFQKSIHHTSIIERGKKQPFGLGVQIGVTECNGKISPYFGIGISYNFLNF